MYITFIIGNGFDKQLGLNTGYDAFVNWYIQQPSDEEEIAQFKKYLSNSPLSPWWSDAERAMGEYLERFTDETVAVFNRQIRDFKLRLVDYLLIEQRKFDDISDEKIESVFSKFLDKFASEIMLNKARNQFNKRQYFSYSFIDFNYTDTLSRIISCVTSDTNIFNIYRMGIEYYSNIEKHIKIHGSLDTSVIMGLNDETQLFNKNVTLSTNLKRRLIKPYMNREMGREEEELANEVLKLADTIVIYGWSMGDTDKIWRDALGIWLKEKKHYLIWIGHKVPEMNMVLPEEQLDYVSAQQERIINKIYGEVNENEQMMLKERVFIISKTRFLDFTMRTEELFTI